MASAKAALKMRVRMAAWGSAKAMAGNVKARMQTHTPVSHPGNPPAENHRNVIEKSKTRRMPNQKSGMATSNLRKAGYGRPDDSVLMGRCEQAKRKGQYHRNKKGV